MASNETQRNLYQTINHAISIEIQIKILSTDRIARFQPKSKKKSLSTDKLRDFKRNLRKNSSNDLALDQTNQKKTFNSTWATTTKTPLFELRLDYTFNMCPPIYCSTLNLGYVHSVHLHLLVQLTLTCLHALFFSCGRHVIWTFLNYSFISQLFTRIALLAH